MKTEYLLPGLVMFGAGFVVLFGLLASVGAMARSKQFSALAALASGAHGGSKRAAFFIGWALLFSGACGTFGGVAKSDAARADACTAWCVSRGHTTGRIGAASNPAPKHPKPACLCEGGATPLEVSVEALVF